MIKKSWLKGFQVLLVIVLVLLVLFWLGYASLMDLILTEGPSYTCDPFDFSSCDYIPFEQPTCPVCPKVNILAVGLIILDLTLLILTSIAVKLRKGR